MDAVGRKASLLAFSVMSLFIGKDDFYQNSFNFLPLDCFLIKLGKLSL